MESNCDDTPKFCSFGNEEISVYNDFIKILLQSALPEQQHDLNKPLQADCFKDFISKSQLNLEKTLSLLSGIDTSEKIPKNVVIHVILFIGEQSKSEVWTNNENVNYAKQLLNEVLTRCKCRSLINLLLLFKVDSFLLELRPKLLKNTWKNYPAAVSCFMWMLFNIECPYLGDVLNCVLPTCLFLVDDHEYRNKVLGLQCLEHIANNVSRTELSQYGRGTVMYKAVEHMIYLREPEIIPPLATCLTALLSKTEHSSITSKLSWSHFDDVLNIWLPAMEMEQKLVTREAYINSLNSLLEAMGLASVRWSKHLLEIFSEYCEQDHTCDKSLINLLTFINATWPRITSNFHFIIVVLMKVAIKVDKDSKTLSLDSECTLKLVKQCLKSLKNLCTIEYNAFLDEIKQNDSMNDYHYLLFNSNNSRPN